MAYADVALWDVATDGLRPGPCALGHIVDKGTRLPKTINLQNKVLSTCSKTPRQLTGFRVRLGVSEDLGLL